MKAPTVFLITNGQKEKKNGSWKNLRKRCTQSNLMSGLICLKIPPNIIRPCRDIGWVNRYARLTMNTVRAGQRTSILVLNFNFIFSISSGCGPTDLFSLPDANAARWAQVF